MKDNTNKYLIMGLVAIAVVYAIDKYLKSRPKPINSDEYSDLDLNTILSKGSTGAEVSELQRILFDQYGADLGYSGVEKNGIDGNFGSMTETALLKAKGVKSISLKDILTKK
jgi:hypothetical protein